MVKHIYAVVAYKESPYLESCLESLALQTVQSPVVVCTSTPNDYIKTLCLKYQFPLFHSTGSGGIDGDWNDALMAVDAQYVTLCHQDDIYEVHYGERIAAQIEKDDSHLILFTDYMELRNEIKIEKSKMLAIKRILLFPLTNQYFQGKRWCKRLTLRFGNPICCPSVTYHKAILPLPLFEKRFKSNLDWQTWEKLSKRTGRFTYINEKLMCHRLHDDSTTSELIRDHLRTQEDEALFSLFWPKPIARLLTKVYASSEKEN